MLARSTGDEGHLASKTPQPGCSDNRGSLALVESFNFSARGRRFLLGEPEESSTGCSSLTLGGGKYTSHFIHVGTNSYAVKEGKEHRGPGWQTRECPSPCPGQEGRGRVNES